MDLKVFGPRSKNFVLVLKGPATPGDLQFKRIPRTTWFSILNCQQSTMIFGKLALVCTFKVLNHCFPSANSTTPQRECKKYHVTLNTHN